MLKDFNFNKTHLTKDKYILRVEKQKKQFYPTSFKIDLIIVKYCF